MRERKAFRETPWKFRRGPSTPTAPSPVGASERASERTRCRSATAMRVERLGFTASLGQSRRCA